MTAWLLGTGIMKLLLVLYVLCAAIFGFGKHWSMFLYYAGAGILTFGVLIGMGKH